MSATINIDIFDPSSVARAVQDIENYKNSLQGKCDELRSRIAWYIAQDASRGFNSSVADDRLKGALWGSVEVTVDDDGKVTVVMAKGKDAVFIEFGAGVYYNGAVGQSPNPLGSDLGFTIGSYGYGNGAKEVWGFPGENGEIILSHGTPASMPMYKAIMAVYHDIERIAREVFST